MYLLPPLHFGNVSGSKLNLTKCEDLWLGKDLIKVSHLTGGYRLQSGLVPQGCLSWGFGPEIFRTVHRSLLYVRCCSLLLYDGKVE